MKCCFFRCRQDAKSRAGVATFVGGAGGLLLGFISTALTSYFTQTNNPTIKAVALFVPFTVTTGTTVLAYTLEKKQENQDGTTEEAEKRPDTPESTATPTERDAPLYQALA